MKARTFSLLILATVTGLLGAAEPDARIAELEAENHRLRELCQQLLDGRRFEHLDFADGRAFDDVTVTRVTGEAVDFTHADGRATVALADGPAGWSALAGGAPWEKTDRPGAEVAAAIVVIEGDAGVGTGFIASHGGKTYLYTAAHVLSGNKRLAVKTRDGRKITGFGDFQAADGADLVRLEVTEPFDAPLAIGSAAGQARQGETVFAAGNAGGGGTVGFEPGEIKGVGPESIEIDAQVIQGNSGGPILDGETHEVIGVVTHLVDARADKWAEETRFSDIRRFGCRLDRDWKWDTLPIGVFLNEGLDIKEFSALNQLVILALSPQDWVPGSLQGFADHPVKREIKALQEWILDLSESGTGVSDSDRKRRITSLLNGVSAASRLQVSKFKPDGYVWFHRKLAREALELREDLMKACAENIDDLR